MRCTLCAGPAVKRDADYCGDEEDDGGDSINDNDGGDDDVDKDENDEVYIMCRSSCEKRR